MFRNQSQGGPHPQQDQVPATPTVASEVTTTTVASDPDARVSDPDARVPDNEIAGSAHDDGERGQAREAGTRRVPSPNYKCLEWLLKLPPSALEVPGQSTELAAAGTLESCFWLPQPGPSAKATTENPRMRKKAASSDQPLPSSSRAMPPIERVPKRGGSAAPNAAGDSASDEEED